MSDPQARGLLPTQATGKSDEPTTAVEVVAPAPAVAAPEHIAAHPTDLTDPAGSADDPAADEARESVECPGCGTVSQVALARRDARDFCATCDFPLFWARDREPFPEGLTPTDSGLRRLPGTAGRVALGALVCPACTEPNIPSADICVRCNAPLHPVAPEPEPVAVVEPEPEPVPEPEQRWRWWPYALAGGLALIALIVLLVVYQG